MLGAVGVVLALLILPYFQKWLVQRSEIESAKAQLSQSRSEVSALKQQKARWADDEYVKAQARQRLHYVLPGETGFVVLQPKKATTKPSDPSVQAAAVPAGNRPWYSDVWLSAQVAADPGK